MHPDRRREKIGHYIPRVARTIAVRDSGIDWQVGFVPDTSAAMKLVKNVYGFRRASPLLIGDHPGYGEEHPQMLVWMAGWEVVAEVAQAFSDAGKDAINLEGSSRLTVVTTPST